MVKEFDRITDYFKPIKNDPRAKDWIHSIVRYAVSVVDMGSELIVKAFSKVFNEQDAEKMAMTTAQKLRAEGEAKMVLTALRTKFKNVPKDIEEEILSMSDSIALESLLAQAIQSDTLEEFAEELR